MTDLQLVTIRRALTTQEDMLTARVIDMVETGNLHKAKHFVETLRETQEVLTWVRAQETTKA